jgi:conjugative transfer signal peptidase TraF
MFAALTFQAFGLRINVTPSIPLGLYVASAELAPVPGMIVEFCPQGMSAEESARYRGFGLACPDLAIPLLKPVAAIAGDEVEFSARGIRVNGRSLANTAPRRTDGKGRAIPAWPASRRRLHAGELVVASSYHPGSFDSRYLGPIRFESIRRTLRPLVVFR